MATTATGIYSETLQSIIDAKLGELERKRSVFEKSKANLLERAGRQSTDTAKLQILVEGVKTTFGIRSNNGRVVTGSSKHDQLEQKLANLERFLAQPRYDPSVSPRLLSEWEHGLHQQLSVQSSRFEYASLYAQLVTEWLAAEKKISVKEEVTDDLQMSGYEELESKQKLESRMQWAKTVFEPLPTDVIAIKAHLKKLFGEDQPTSQIFKALQRLRSSVTNFQNRMAQPNQFDEQVLKWVIEGLLVSDLLTEDKRNVLRDFLPNSIILNELADVLNLRISSIDTWSWGRRVPLEQKRNIQAHFVIVMHEDLLQAIFLQYIGVKWSVFLKEALGHFLDAEGAWVPAAQDIPQEDWKRRAWFLGAIQDKDDSLQHKRDCLWRSSFFMSQLPDSEDESNDHAEGEVEADYAPTGRTKQMARRGAPASGALQAPRFGFGQSAYPVQAQQMQMQQQQQQLMTLQQQNKKRKKMRMGSDHPQVKRPENPTQAKQTLLHLLSSEMIINTRLYGGLTAFRGQFDSWNPLLPHSTILAVIEYLGVSRKWVKFFQKFLEAPLGFDDEDEVHHRKRGIPGSHALSDLLGECVLFCLDLSVNQATNGARFWRVHDDFWFWSKDDETSVAAWNTIVDFSQLMGLSLDQNKCGGTRVGAQPSRITEVLPRDTVRWGFLYLDSKSGRFLIDQQIIDRHIGDLHRQLNAKTKSVFSWIEAWNAYANTFFTTNFGKPVNCFGQEHIDQILSTLERAQRKIFENDHTVNSVVGYLKATLSARFGMEDIPEGYVFFPSALGGLELRNPFVVPLQLRDAVLQSPTKLLEQFVNDEKEAYRVARQQWERGMVPHNDRSDAAPKDKTTFLSFEEYTRYREEFQVDQGRPLASVFLELMEQPTEDSIIASSEMLTALNLMDKGGVVGEPGKCGINGNWWDMQVSPTPVHTSSFAAANVPQPYWKWILGLHGPEVLSRFGGLNIVDNGVLPIGMVSLFRSQGISWSD